MTNTTFPDEPEDVGGFASIPRWLQRSQAVSWRAKLVYLALSSRVGETGAAWPSHATIAAESSCSVTSVKRALAELRDLGVVSWSGRTRDDAGATSNVYRLSVSRPVDNSAEGVGLTGLPPTQVGLTGLGGRPHRATNESQKNEEFNQSSDQPHLEAVDNFSGDDDEYPHPTPTRAFADRHSLDHSAIAASVGEYFIASGITNDQLQQLSLTILGRAKARVLDPTAYVIQSIRNDLIEWQAFAFDMAADRRAAGGNPF